MKNNDHEDGRDRPEIRIRSRGVPYLSHGRRRFVHGFILVDGTVLLEGDRDGDGVYWGRVEQDGTYWGIGRCYVPVRSEGVRIRAFLDVSKDYLRNEELSEEQNFDMINGRIDNLPPEREPPRKRKTREPDRER